MPRGRPKGARNKTNKQALAIRLDKAYPEYDPVLAMAGNAIAIQNEIHKVEESINDPNFEGTVDVSKLNEMRSLANDEHNRVAQYLCPKLKAVEMTGGAKMLIRVKDLSGGS